MAGLTVMPFEQVNSCETEHGCLIAGVVVCSVCFEDNRILVGTQDSEIFEILHNEPHKVRCLMRGHAPGELWALATHPNPKKSIFATGSDDKTVRCVKCQC